MPALMGWMLISISTSPYRRRKLSRISHFMSRKTTRLTIPQYERLREISFSWNLRRGLTPPPRKHTTTFYWLTLLPGYRFDRLLVL